MQYIAKVLLSVAAVVASTVAMGQKVSFGVEAPGVVAVGEIFRVEYVANTKPDDFSGPSFSGLEVIAGPTLSTSKSWSLVNGNMSQSAQYTYTYVLRCSAEGEYTVPAASVRVDGKEYSAGPVSVRAIAEAVSAGGDSGGGVSAPKAVLAPEDIVVRAVVDKREVYKGEPVKVTYKLYRRVPLSIESARFPSYDGFWAQQLNVNGYPVQREELDGRIYDTHVIREDLLFPQQAGKLTIEPLQLGVVAQIVMQSRRQSLIDDFFNGPDVQEVRRSLSTPPVTIEVRDLPEGAPASFSGAVGEFAMESLDVPAQVAANSAFTYGIKISGRGNLPQVQAPELSLPGSFEQYNVKTTESFNNTSGGIYGYRQFDYPVIARAEGDYRIDPVEFTYFDPRQRAYRTLRSAQRSVHVAPDSTGAARISPGAVIGGFSKEDLRILGHDIRFIKLGAPHLRPVGHFFFGSVMYWTIAAVMTAAGVLLLLWFRRVARERRNSALLKGKRANKVALQRFRAAEAHMKTDNARGFYEEMLRALWGYMGDKLNIPASLLSKENVREELVKRGVGTDTALRYIEIIGECEYAQYAPAASGRMNDIYTAGVEIVSRLENIIGR